MNRFVSTRSPSDDHSTPRRLPSLAHSATNVVPITGSPRRFRQASRSRWLYDCSVMPTPRQARERTQRARDADRREIGRDRKYDRSARLETGGSLNDISLVAPGALALRRLATQLARYAPHDDVFPLRLPGTYAVRRSRLTTEPTYSTASPALCVVAQGAKAVMLGREVLEYDPAHLLVFAVDLPVSSQVTRASLRDPYLGFVLRLDPTRVAELAVRVYPRGVPKTPENRGLYVGRATDGIVDAVTRCSS